MTNADIQAGEYVRTKNGSIFKIIGGNADDYLIDVDYHDLQKMEDDIYDELMWLNYNDNGNFIRRITKNHSFNIIDLIEVGDYVNGLPVRFVEKARVDIGQEENYIWLRNEHIQTIITHEQFEAMEYKVGG